MKRWFLYLPIFLLLFGCSNISGENEMKEQVEKIRTSLEKPDWNQVKELADELHRMYDENEWKLQLLGDEDEYESLYESINHLLVSVEEKDVKDTKLELASIQTFLKDIYSN